MSENQGRGTRGAKKKKLKGWQTALIVLGGIIVVLGIAGLILANNLLNRISRPQEPATFTEETPAPEATPAPTPEASADASLPTPEPTPSPTPEIILPLRELCSQTSLSAEQYLKMEEHNANTAQFYNVLLLGVDRRGNSGNSQTDTMMIATVDKAHNRLKLTSVMRDTLVEIPEHGEFRLNSAAVKGGVELLFSTINHNFHLPLDKYVLVDFSMFEKIIDKLGGVTVRMTAEEISAANDCIAGLNKQLGVEYLWDGFIFADEGNVLLTGKQALGYARIRKIDSDFTRTNRQYKVLNAVFAKFKSQSLTKQYDLMYELLPLVETNLGNDEIINMAVSVLGMDVGGLLHYRLPADATYAQGKFHGSSVLLADLSQNAWLLHEFIFESSDAPEEAKVLTPVASNAPRTPAPTIDPFAPIPYPDTTDNGFGGFGFATPLPGSFSFPTPIPSSFG